jgi:serine/threonine protein kinase
MLEREQKRPRIGMLDCLWMYEVWLKETEDINTQDTTVCTVLSSPIHLILVLEYRKHGELLSYLRQRAPTATYIDQQSPITLARYDQVRLASRNECLVLMKSNVYSKPDELTYLCKCRHPYINTLLDVRYKSDKTLFLVLEYHPLGDLEQYLRKQKKQSSVITAAIMSQWMRQMLEAVAHMHELNVVHCDIKLPNIFVVNPSRLCIGDLGQAQHANADDECEIVSGTPAYDAPELEYSNNSRKSDMWCLGCVFLEAMTLVLIFDVGGTHEQWAQKGVHVKNLDKVTHIYPFFLRDMVCKCMQLAPQMRPSAKDLLLTLA